MINVNIPIYKPKKSIIILSGGGFKGIAHIGVFKALEETKNIKYIKTFVGTSIGSFICSLYVIGYNSNDLFDIVNLLHLNKTKNINFENLFMYYGFDNGDKIEIIIKKLLKAKNYNENATLLDVYRITNKRLILSTTCINSTSVKYLSHTNFPTLSLWKAIRMSISIPFYFTPVLHKKKLYIDGACMDNYPIHIFKHMLNKVFGVYLFENKNNKKNIKNLETYTFSIIDCLMKGVDCNSIKGYEKYTIILNTNNISVLDYNLSNYQKKNLLNIGYENTLNFINLSFPVL